MRKTEGPSEGHQLDPRGGGVGRGSEGAMLEGHNATFFAVGEFLDPLD